MSTPREDLLRCLRRKGFEQVHTDFVFCKSQIEAFRQRFGHSDYESFFGLSHRKLEIPVKINYSDGQKLFPRETLPESTVFDEYGIGHSKGSAAAFHMTRMHYPLRGAGLQEINEYPYPTVDESNQTINNLTKCGSKGGIVIGPTHIVEPEVPWENLVAITNAVHEFEENRKKHIFFLKARGFCFPSPYY